MANKDLAFKRSMLVIMISFCVMITQIDISLFNVRNESPLSIQHFHNLSKELQKNFFLCNSSDMQVVCILETRKNYSLSQYQHEKRSLEVLHKSPKNVWFSGVQFVMAMSELNLGFWVHLQSTQCVFQKSMIMFVGVVSIFYCVCKTLQLTYLQNTMCPKRN